MTEEEAANRLCALLNEIEQAGLQVSVDTKGRESWIWVGNDLHVVEPVMDDQPWEVRES